MIHAIRTLAVLLAALVPSGETGAPLPACPDCCAARPVAAEQVPPGVAVVCTCPVSGDCNCRAGKCACGNGCLCAGTARCNIVD